jgi:tetratricopeptide (TPR) repeat protein
MRRHINGKFLIILVATIAVLGTGTHFLHGFQVQRHAEAFLQQADREEQAENLRQAKDYLYRYLLHRPNDASARTRYATLLDQLATTDRDRVAAYSALEQAVRLDPDNEALRRRVVRSALGVGHIVAAREHLQQLLKANPTDAELHLELGLCQEVSTNEKGAFQYDAAEQSYLKAIQHEPHPIAAFQRLALLLRRHRNNAEAADKVMKQLDEVHPNSPQALIARARYYQAFGQPLLATQDAKKARDLAPKDVQILLSVGQINQAQNRPDEARACYEAAVQGNTKEPTPYLALADLEAQRRDLPKAAAAVRRGLEAVPNDPALLRRLVELQIGQGQLEEARKAVTQLEEISKAVKQPRDKKVLGSLVDYFHARLDLAGEDWRAGLERLERVRPQLADWPELARQADMALAEGYVRMGDPDRQILLYRRALASAPLAPALRHQYAASLLAQGRVEEALAESRQLVKLTDEAPDSLLLLGQVLFRRTLAMAQAKRDWRELNHVLEQAAAKLPDSLELQVLRSNTLVAQEHYADGRQILEKLRTQHPKRIEPWANLVALADRPGEDPKAVTDLLDRTQQEVGDTVDVRLLRARYWGRRRGPEARKGLAQLQQGLEKFSAADQVRLLSGLAEAAARLGDLAESERFWKEVAGRQKDNVNARLMLVELALLTDKPDAVPAYADEIKRIEGEEGTLWRYAEVSRTLHLARAEAKGRKERLTDARRRIGEIASRRPTWPRVPLLEAEIWELEGQKQNALAAYYKALDLGEQRSRMILRMVDLHRELGRPADADDLLRKIDERTGLSLALGRAAAEVALALKENERALKIALGQVPPDTTEYKDFLWLSQFHGALNRPEEQERCLRRATELGGKDAVTWQALVLYLASRRQKDAVEKVLQEMHKALPSEQATIVAAQAHEVIGRFDASEKEWLAALKARPDDPGLQRQLASAYLRRSDFLRAEPLLRKLLAAPATPPLDLLWARRNLAVGIALRGGHGQSKKALDLIDENLRDGRTQVEDLRAKAVIVATLPGQQEQSLRLLEESKAQGPLVPSELYMLAQLYRWKRDWKGEKDALQKLVNEDDRNPLFLGYFIEELLAHNEQGQARHWLKRLREIDPDGFTTVALEARLEHVQGRTKEAVEHLTAYAQKAGPDRFGSMAQILEGMGQFKEAEDFLRKAPADAKHPDTVLRLLAFLARRGRVPEMLEQLDRAWKILPPELVASGTLGLLGLVKLTPEQCQRVERPIEEALKKADRNPSLLISLAIIREFHENRPGDAIPLYRKALEEEQKTPPAPNAGNALRQNEKNLVAMNNLALLLALHARNHGEALALAEEALKLGGPEAALLDTRGVVHLAAGRGNEAVRDFDNAVAAGPTPYRYFHLAQARLSMKERKAAEDAFTKAKAAGLQPSQIHPLERDAYTRMTVELAPR